MAVNLTRMGANPPIPFFTQTERETKMDLDKVVKILTSDMDNVLISSVADLRAAKKLGIEALKREKRNREDPNCVIVGLLPGETDE